MKKCLYKGFTIIAVLLLNVSIKAQQIDFKSDIKTINKRLSEKLPDPYKRPYIYKDEASVIKKINPVHIVFGISLYVYQNVIQAYFRQLFIYSQLFRVQ
jgi:hypothetical protein